MFKYLLMLLVLLCFCMFCGFGCLTKANVVLDDGTAVDIISPESIPEMAPTPNLQTYTDQASGSDLNFSAVPTMESNYIANALCPMDPGWHSFT